MNDAPTWTLGDALRKARLAAGMDQIDIAVKLKISRVTASNYETGRSEPPTSVFVAWARATGVSLDWLAEAVKPRTAPSEDGAVDGSRPRESNPRPSHYE
ncbi:helix-turn-helix domain-containing protein [Plantibacter sp. RU18]